MPRRPIASAPMTRTPMAEAPAAIAPMATRFQAIAISVLPCSRGFIDVPPHHGANATRDPGPFTQPRHAVAYSHPQGKGQEERGRIRPLSETLKIVAGPYVFMARV